MKIKLIVLLNFLAQIYLCAAQIVLTPAQVQQRTFDYVIVGAGSAGATIAARLTENPLTTVLVVEAGTYPIPLSTVPTFFVFQAAGPNAWHYPLDPNSTCDMSFIDTVGSYTQGKALGGSSSINGMIFIRASPANYDTWVALGLTDWSYDDILPYYIKMEDNVVPGQSNNSQVHGTDGPITVSSLDFVSPSLQNFLAGAELNGFTSAADCNAGNNLNKACPLVFSIRNGSRCGTLVGYLDTYPTKTNLFLSINSYVTKVLFSGLNATGVQFNQDGANYTAKADKEVILSAGTIGSPKILLQSGVGPKAHLEQFNVPLVLDLEGVGNNLQDHVACNALVWTLNCSGCAFPASDSLPLAGVAQYIASSDGGLVTLGGIEGTLFINSQNKSNVAPDVQIFYVSNHFPTTQPDITTYYAGLGNATSTMSIVVVLVQPKSRGFVRLNSTNPLDYPLLNYGVFSDPQDLPALMQGIKMGKAIGDSAAFASLGAQFIPGAYPGCEGPTLYSDEYWNCTVNAMKYLLLHNVGTCKMGLANDPMAVVDQQLRVLGAQGLRVADASIMPVTVSANTNPSTIAIGEKAAAMIIAPPQP